MLLDLAEAGQAQRALLRIDPKDDKLIEAFDAINDRLGPRSIQFGHAGQAGGWQSSSARRSPCYTTRWADTSPWSRHEASGSEPAPDRLASLENGRCSVRSWPSRNRPG